MRDLWFGLGHFFQNTFDWFLTPFGWTPPIIFTLVLTFGFVYWMVLQGRYNRRAKERGERA